MKMKLFFCCMMGFLAVACAATSPRPLSDDKEALVGQGEREMEISSESKKKILTQFTREVWNEGNIEAADKYIASKYTIHHDPGDPWEGRELDLAGYKERVAALRAAFPDQFFDIQGLFADGNAVVMTWLWSATHKGDIPGFPATGKKIKMSGATVYYFDGARLAGHWQITDRLGVYQQLRQISGSAAQSSEGLR